MHQSLAYIHSDADIARNVVIEPFVTIEKNVSEIGGGSLPGQELETYVLAINERHLPLEDQASFRTKLRESTPAVIGRSENSKLIFDLRTIHTNQIKTLANIINSINT